MEEVFQEPATFRLKVTGIKGAEQGKRPTEVCRVAHYPGQVFEFSYATPEGLCGECYHGMYGLIVALRSLGDMRQISNSKDEDKVSYKCPKRSDQLRAGEDYPGKISSARFPPAEEKNDRP